MSDDVWSVVLLLALVLASYSFAVLLGFAPVVERGTRLQPKERPRRALLIGLTAGAGVIAVGSAFDWSEWPAGLLLGVAVVELGPYVYTKAKGAIGRLFSAFRPGAK